MNAAQPAAVRGAGFPENRVQFGTKNPKSIPAEPSLDARIIGSDEFVVRRREQLEEQFETFSSGKDGSLPLSRVVPISSNETAFEKHYCIIVRFVKP